MADAVEAGKVRAVGVSNYSAEQMRIAHAALGAPASTAPDSPPAGRQPETNGVLDTCREVGVTLIAYQPLASGALTGKYPAGPDRGACGASCPTSAGTGGTRSRLWWPCSGRSVTGHGTGPTQVELRWLIENDSVLPIPGAKNGTQALANAKALTFSLSPDELETLTRATLAWRD